MIEIYKKLPKTNCRKCGAATCMAFAMSVKKGQTALSDCPYVIDAATDGPHTASPAASSSGYRQVAQVIEKEAVAVDFREAAEAVGGSYASSGGKEAIRLRMINKTYEISKEGLFENNIYSSDTWARIIICDYVRRHSARPPTGELIGLGHFPHTASHVKAFQTNAEKKLAGLFKNNAPGLRQRCLELGGTEAPDKLKADYSVRFDLLPNVPLYLFLWSSDEEFDADCKILFDRSAEAHIDIEYLANLLERFTSEFAD
ncbi:MAG: DUF3786 domain-containing protein [Thermodesulfovibrionales bacterium]